MADLLTPEEAAERAKLHPQTIRRMCARGELHALKLAGKWRIPEKSLLAPAKPARIKPSVPHDTVVGEASNFGRHLRAIKEAS